MGTISVETNPIICVDQDHTRTPEDGFYPLTNEETLSLKLTSVSITQEVVREDIILRTLGKRKYQIESLGFPMMCTEEYINTHNYSIAAPVPSILVTIKCDKITGYTLATVELAHAKVFRRYTYSTVQTFLEQENRRAVFNLAEGILAHLNRLGYLPNFQEEGHRWLPRAHNLTRRLLWLFNETCKEFCNEHKIPYLGAPVKGRHEILVHTDAIPVTPIFSCPFRHPVATLNNQNLSYFLVHKIPYYTQEELQEILNASNKEPMIL